MLSAGGEHLHVKRVSKLEKGNTEGCIQAEHLSGQKLEEWQAEE